MDVMEAIRTAGTCRYYTDQPLEDDVLERVLDASRWGPQGGNRQPVRFVVVRDAAKKAQLAEWYRVPWGAYVEGVEAGVIAIDSPSAARIVKEADDFAKALQDVPAIIVVCAVAEDIHPTDLELDRDSITYGCSVYPSVQNLLLAARDEGLGAALTTLLCIYEPQVKEMLNIPDGVMTACHIAIGWPGRPHPKKLARNPLGPNVYLDEYGAPLFDA